MCEKQSFDLRMYQEAEMPSSYGADRLGPNNHHGFFSCLTVLQTHWPTSRDALLQSIIGRREVGGGGISIVISCRSRKSKVKLDVPQYIMSHCWNNVNDLTMFRVV